MKVPRQRVAAFLAAPDPGVRAALLYGPDGGLVRERADRIAAAICPDITDAFRVAELDGERLAGDETSLNDEAASLCLAGGRRVIRIRDGSDALGAIFDRFLKAPPPGDAFVLVEAGDLGPRSSLRRAFEGAKAGAALGCYCDGPREVRELARDLLGAHHIELKPEAGQFLAAHLGGDRMVSRSELEKLALYVGDGGVVGEDEALAVVGDAAELSIDDVVFAAADGDALLLERALGRAFSEGAQPVAILRAALGHFQRLHLAQARLAAGSSQEDALAKLHPPVFFKFAGRFKGELLWWPLSRAASALDVLDEAERQAKTTGLPQETICRAALLRIARAAAAAKSPP